MATGSSIIIPTFDQMNLCSTSALHVLSGSADAATRERAHLILVKRRIHQELFDATTNENPSEAELELASTAVLIVVSGTSNQGLRARALKVLAGRGLGDKAVRDQWAAAVARIKLSEKKLASSREKITINNEA